MVSKVDPVLMMSWAVVQKYNIFGTFVIFFLSGD